MSLVLDQTVEAVLSKGSPSFPPALKRAFPALSTLAALGLLAALLFRPRWALEALLVATLVTAGLSQVGIVLSAIIQITRARWGRSFKRITELTLAGAPLALLGLLVLFATSSLWAPFAHPEHRLEGGKAAWLSLTFWGIRNFLAVAGLFALSAWYVYLSIRPDLGLAMEKGRPYPGRLAAWAVRGWRGLEEESRRSQARMSVLAPILCIAYALVYSMVGIDLVMALDPDWYSTLFGGYHFIGNVYMGLALAILLALALRKFLGVRVLEAGKEKSFLSGKHFGILGALLFAFCLVNGDFFWSQFLTIWYGNLPEETSWVILRTMDPDFPWRHLAWAVLAGFFFIPFGALLFRAVKWSPPRVSLVAAVVLLSIVGERFLTTAPPLLRVGAGSGFGAILPPLLLAYLVTLGFLGAGGWIYGRLMAQVPLLPLSDPLLTESLKDSEERH